MKLSELKTRLKNKYVVRIVAGVLTIALLGSSMTAVAVQADQKKDAAVQTEQKEDSSDKKDDIEDLLQVSVSDKEIGKDENVYLISDATGSVYDTIVTDHLINKNLSATLEDQSNLTDIKNVKGSEEFSQNGEKLTWQADGADIYYQGKTDSEAPVSLKVTYYLDGNEISPEDLAGKSGKVKIRLDYTSNETVTKEVNGKDEDISVPFVAVSGMVLGDNFKNIQVTNGKYLAQGESNIVVGYAIPGLDDGVKDAAADLDTEIPEYVEVSADVTDFSLDMTVTLLVNGSEMNFSGGVDLTDLDKLTDSLSSAGDQLADGSGELSDGATQVSDGAGTLADKMGDLTSGAGSLKAGMESLSSSSGDLSNGVSVINQSAQAIAAGVNTLDTAVNTKMTEEEQAAVAKQAASQVSASVEAQFAAGTDTYNYIYNSAVNNYTTSMSNATDQIAQAYINSDAYTAFYNAALSSKAMEYATENAPKLMQAYNLDYQTAFNQAYNGALQNAELQAGVAASVQGAFKQMAQQTTTSLAEGGKAAIGQSVVDACKSAATQAASQAAGQAAVQGAETAKATIAS